MLNPKHGVALVIACLLFCGCTPDKLSDVELPIPDASDSLADVTETTSTLKVSNSNDGVSPAASPFKVPDINATPEAVCRQFIDLLNRGDSDRFELLLTPAAMSVSSKLQFSLPPLGEPNANISVQPPAFSTIREKLCFVECSIEDSETTKVDLMLRKAKQGWRIAGMMVDGESAESKNLLSFESMTDVSQIRDSLNASVDNHE